MSQSALPEPSYAEVKLTAPPETVARLMEALGTTGEVLFDHRGEPGTRGDIVCTARVAVIPPSPAPSATGTVEVVVQSALTADTSRWPGLDEPAGAGQFEEALAAALASLDGVDAVRSRTVAVTTRSPRPAAG
ncbi:hypothetical protein ACWDYK_15650 [Streptomyces anthocyanicus]|uniref:hypothetical protein n=1 Tax=Streptomyces anthocyanicus TaxID=68174 RepID=UPI002F91526F|nr:hypothetical protein OHA15_41820 [Streptomyces anthocyanicus]